MSETDSETPSPTPAGHEAPTAVAVADPPVTESESPPAVGPVSPPASASPPPTREHRSVQVPMWFLAVLGVVVLMVGSFFLGRATAPEDAGPSSLADAVEETARGELELGEFDARALLDALQQNEQFDLGFLGGLLEDLGRR